MRDLNVRSVLTRLSAVAALERSVVVDVVLDVLYWFCIWLPEICDETVLLDFIRDSLHIFNILSCKVIHNMFLVPLKISYAIFPFHFLSLTY